MTKFIYSDEFYLETEFEIENASLDFDREEMVLDFEIQAVAKQAKYREHHIDGDYEKAEIAPRFFSDGNEITKDQINGDGQDMFDGYNLIYSFEDDEDEDPRILVYQGSFASFDNVNMKLSYQPNGKYILSVNAENGELENTVLAETEVELTIR